MSHRLHPIQQLFGRYDQLRHLQAGLDQHKDLLSAVRQEVPDGLAQHCVNASLGQAQLIISTDTPVWANKLRFLAPQLLSTLRQSYPGIASVKVRSAPPVQNKTPDAVRKKVKSKRRYPEHISITLEQQATYLPSTELGDALKRLAKTLKN